MTQLQTLLGEDGVRWAVWGGIGLVALLAILLIIIVLKRIFAPAFNMSSAADRRGRPPRLGVTDFFNLDRTGRRLVIVRRDNVEHLVMVGGPNDVVIETNIVRGLRPEVSTVDSTGRPTVQPRQIDNASLDGAPAGVFETGLPQRELAARSAPVPPSLEPRFEPQPRVEPRAAPAFELKTPEVPAVEIAAPEPRSSEPRLPEPRLPEPPPVVVPQPRLTPTRQPAARTPEPTAPAPKLPEPKPVEPPPVPAPEFRSAKLVPSRAPQAAPEPPAKPDFQMPDFDELAALAKDTSRNALREPPASSPTQRNWPGPAQAAPAHSELPAPEADSKPQAAEPIDAPEPPVVELPPREPPKRTSFEDVSKRLQEALRRPQALTPSAITTSTARATAVTAPIQPAPFSPTPPPAASEMEGTAQLAGEADVPADGQAKPAASAAQSDELDLEQEMARLLGRSPGSKP
ncbi:MAG: hypothetical protein K2P80_08215 [Beijerinckiaceae bacterium]|nr:hypothetical protein [Beijerinckiaceae bacterium]